MSLASFFPILLHSSIPFGKAINDQTADIQEQNPRLRTRSTILGALTKPGKSSPERKLTSCIPRAKTKTNHPVRPLRSSKEPQPRQRGGVPASTRQWSTDFSARHEALSARYRLRACLLCNIVPQQQCLVTRRVRVQAFGHRSRGTSGEGASEVVRCVVW